MLVLIRFGYFSIEKSMFFGKKELILKISKRNYFEHNSISKKIDKREKSRKREKRIDKFVKKYIWIFG